MTQELPDRWRRIEEVYHQALELPASERAAFLDHVCADDRQLRSELNSLLAEGSAISSFMRSPAIEQAARDLADAEPLHGGQQIGSLRILSLAGSGNMGEVYRAHDTTLGREVALKVLPPSLALDPARVARFDLEARLLATLSHPHIATIHGIEQLDDRKILVLEFVEGVTLAERVSARALPVIEALNVALQIADALESAHARGIVHRDLKPANIKIRPDGHVKVLDFGLAKALGANDHLASFQGSSTGSSSALATQPGVRLGTAAYMPPEQARGEPVDQRADIWAFGCVLYEMLTGSAPFTGGTADETLEHVLERSPDFARLPPDTPTAIARLLRRCLEKDPRERLQEFAEARGELRDALASLTAPREHARPARRIALWAAGLVAAAIIAGFTLWWRSDVPARPVVRSLISVPSLPPVTTSRSSSDVAISPDASHIAYSIDEALLIRPVDQLAGTPLVEGTASLTLNPFFSPDGAWIGYVSPTGWQKVSVLGGPPVFLWPTAGNSRGASWEPDGTILFAYQGSGLWQGSGDGGPPRQLTTPDRRHGETGHYYPYALPGGRAVLFTIERRGATDMDIAVLDRGTGETKILLAGGSSAKYISTGHIVYGWKGTLQAVRFDPQRLEVIGNPVTVAQGVVTKPSAAVDFDIARDGSLVYVTGGEIGEPRRVLVWVDRERRESPIDAPPRTYLYPRISPDGTEVALDIRDEENDIWIWSFSRGEMRRVTFDPGLDRAPVWSQPDGLRIAFSSEREKTGAANVFWRLADGTGPVEQLTSAATVRFPSAFSPDGSVLVLSEAAQDDGWSIRLVAPGGKGPERSLTQPPSKEFNAEISADGRWLAYESIEAGEPHVYVRPFPDVPGGHRQRISPGRGTRPVWSRDGRELFYLIEPARIVAVPVEADDSGNVFDFGTAKEVLNGPYITDNALRTYDVSPDGQRFLMIKALPETAEDEHSVVLVQNWGEELKRLVSGN